MADVRRVVAEDVGARVVEVLDEGLRVRPRGAGVERDLVAGDVAVLVRTGAQAAMVQEALRRRGVPCVLARGPSVFSTPAARDWLALLEAVEQPHRIPRVRRLAVSSFIGTSAGDLDAAGDAATDQLAVRLRQWALVLGERGVAGLFAVVGEQQQVSGRLLAVEGGERLLTDLRHIAETLHADVSSGGLASLLSWLRARVEEAAGDVDQERSRRLDTDRDAVQIATVHTSKGLEFEVVLVPFGWDSSGAGSRDRLPVAHAPDGPRALHVGGQGSSGYDAFCRAADAEDAGEELRLFYVAVTRAVSRLLVWWAPSTNTARGALHRLLFTDDPAVVPDKVALPTDAVLRTRLERLWGPDPAAAVGITVEDVALPSDERRHVRPPGSHRDLTAARFRAEVDLGWRRTSYSGLTRAVHELAHSGVGGHVGAGAADAVVSEPETTGTADESDVTEAGTGVADGGDLPGWRTHVSPMADLPAGAGFGTTVHAVLEHFDPAAPDRAAHLAALTRAQFAPALAEPLSIALQPSLLTPLGPLVGQRALADFTVADRLNELDFELPLAGGDDAARTGPRLGDVAALLRRHLPTGDPVLVYADALDEPVLAAESLRGYLTGSIDAVLRTGSIDAVLRTGVGAGVTRYVVVDYKTNRLAGPGETLTAWHYRREALDDAVRAAHYPLQALLYCVALHRFLRWRQPG
ncbi:MAG: 3'-5' exonuclease, partial [Janthinobacterium lividum]